MDVELQVVEWFCGTIQCNSMVRDEIGTLRMFLVQRPFVKVAQEHTHTHSRYDDDVLRSKLSSVRVAKEAVE